jgi:hypothetical protein
MTFSIKTNSFPDLAESMKLLKFSVELEGVDSNTIFGHCIKEWLREKKSIRELVKTIQEQAMDNYHMVLETIGDEHLLSEILQF